jgi:hypothetical protein
MLPDSYQTMHGILARTVPHSNHPSLTLYGLTFCDPACGESSVRVYRFRASQVQHMPSALLQLDGSRFACLTSFPNLISRSHSRSGPELLFMD